MVNERGFMDKNSKDIDDIIKTMEKNGFTVRPESAIDSQKKYFLNKSDIYFDPPKKMKVGKYGHVALVMEVNNKNFFPLNIFPALRLTIDGTSIFIPGMCVEGFFLHLRIFKKPDEKINRLQKSMDKIEWILADFHEKLNKLSKLEIGSDQKIDSTLELVLKEVTETRFSNIFNAKMKDLVSIIFVKTNTWEFVKFPPEFISIANNSQAENILEAMIATQYNFCFSSTFVFHAFGKNTDGETISLRAKSIKTNYRNTIFKKAIAKIYFQTFFDTINEVKRFNMKDYFNT